MKKKRIKRITSVWKSELPVIGTAVFLFIVPPLCVLAAGGYSGYSSLKVNTFSLAQWQKKDGLEAAVYLATRSNAKQDTDKWKDVWNEEEECSDTENASCSNTKKREKLVNPEKMGLNSDTGED